MTTQHAFLAIDLGAESGRVTLGILEDEKITLHELHRFANHPIRLATGLHWDFDLLIKEIFNGMHKAASHVNEEKLALRSIGVDSWGVDYGLLDQAGNLLEPPHCYRDERNQPAYESTIEAIGKPALYQQTGIQFMALNTLFQLVAARNADADLLLSRADRLLFIPDLIHYILCGAQVSELSIASTSQLLDPHTHEWHEEMIQSLGIPTQILPIIVNAGTDLGPIHPPLAKQLGLDPSVRIVTPAAHDTASAVAAIPAQSVTNWCFLSSGTWSLLGAELAEPCITEAARSAPFTNEKGIAGTTRFLKNITGLYLVQECQRDLKTQGQAIEIAELLKLAEEAEPFCTLMNPDWPPFSEPGAALKKICTFARLTDQPEPTTVGSYIRTCLESLALCYRQTLQQLEQTLDRNFEVMHIVGGGARNQLLNQMTADACNRRLEIGPVEATSIGNLLTQAMGLGYIKTPAQIRTIVRNTVDLRIYQPINPKPWDEVFERYSALAQFVE